MSAMKRLICAITQHRDFPSSRWVQSGAPHRKLNDELWTFWICERCGKVTRAYDSGKRWDTTGPPQTWERVARIEAAMQQDRSARVVREYGATYHLF